MGMEDPELRNGMRVSVSVSLGGLENTSLLNPLYISRDILIDDKVLRNITQL